MSLSPAAQQHADALEAILATRNANMESAKAAGTQVVGADGLVPMGIDRPQTPQHVIDRARAAGVEDADDAAPMVGHVDSFNVTIAVNPSDDDEPIEEVPEDLVGALKAKAAKIGVSDVLRRIRVEGIAHEFIMRKPTRAEWHEYLNAAMVASQSSAGEWNLVIQCGLWPGLAAIKAAAATQPSVIKKVVDAIERWVGGEQGQAEKIEYTLTADTTDDALAEVGLTRDDVEPLLARYPGRNQIKVVGVFVSPADTDESEADIATVVVRSPPKPVYDKFILGYRSGDKAAACYDMAMSCIVWPEAEQDRRSLIRDQPGLPWTLFATLGPMGGTGSKVTAKNL